MTMVAPVQMFALDAEGNILVDATLEVRRESDNVKPSLYDGPDTNIASLVNNPAPADSEGLILVYVPNGTYKLTFSNGVSITVFRHYPVFYQDQGVSSQDSPVVSPEHATDSGTDAFVSATNTTPPGDGKKITRDFITSNSGSTPTLDSKTMTTKDGSALWAGSVSGVHDLQYDLTADTYLVLEPLGTLNDRPLDTDDLAASGGTIVQEGESPDFGGATISATQYGWLGGLASAPLEDNDLAANGGKLLQVDQAETIPGNYTFTNAFGIRIDAVAPRVEYAESDTTDENFYVRLNSGILEIAQRADDFTVLASPARVRLFAGGGTLHGEATGGDPGLGKINAEGLEINGAAVGPIESAVVALGGDFGGGEKVLCQRQGNKVMITALQNLSFASDSNPASAAGAIPSSFRPSDNLRKLCAFNGPNLFEVQVTTSGLFALEFRDDALALTNSTNSGIPPSVEYLIT